MSIIVNLILSLNSGLIAFVKMLNALAPDIVFHHCVLLTLDAYQFTIGFTKNLSLQQISPIFMKHISQVSSPLDFAALNIINKHDHGQGV